MWQEQWLEKECAIGDLPLQCAAVLRDTRLRYLQRGQPNAPKDNIILLPTYYGGALADNIALATGDSPLADPHWCLLIPGMLGSGQSTSPCNATATQRGMAFPRLRLADQVHAQQRMIKQLFGDVRLALVAGWSLGGMQSLQWGCLYPQQVQRVAAWCSGVRCYPHNQLFLRGLQAALEADPRCYSEQKAQAGLRAFAYIYASRAYGPAFLREQLYRALGHDSLQALLDDWQREHLVADQHNLLAVLDMWLHADISDNAHFHGNLSAALEALSMPALMMAARTDQYFLLEEMQADAAAIPAARFAVLETEWGHCAGGPGREPAAMRQLTSALAELLARE